MKFIVIACLTSFVALEAWGEQAGSQALDRRTRDLLFSTIEDSRKAITSAYLEYSWLEEMANPPGPISLPGASKSLSTQGMGKTWRSGNWFHDDTTVLKRWEADKREILVRRIAIRNANSFIVYEESENSILRYHFPAPNILTQTTIVAAAPYPVLDVLSFGHMVGSRSINHMYDAMSKFGNHFEWRCIPAADAQALPAELHVVANGRNGLYLSDKLVFAPKAGHTISEFENYNEDGTLNASRSVTMQEVAKGIWIAKSGRETYSVPETTLKFTVENVEVNKAMDHTLFTLEAFALDPSLINLYEIFPDGRRLRYGLSKQEWTPFEQLPPDKRQLLQRKPVLQFEPKN